MSQKFARLEKDVYRPKHRRFNKNTDRRWRVVYPNPTSLGTRKETFRTEEQALERIEFLNNCAPSALKYESWTVLDAVNLWEENKLSRLKSYRRDISKIRLIRSELGRIFLRELTEEHIGRFKRLLESRYQIRTVNAYLVTLRTILNYIRKKGIIHVIPDISEYIETALEERRERVLSQVEFERLLKSCYIRLKGRDRKQLIPYLIWLHETGCRAGELAQIRIRDIHMARGVVRIWSGKTKRPIQRECGITPRLQTLIEDLALLQTRNSDELVFNEQVEWKRCFRTACRLAGLEDFRIHDLRRTAITNMLEKGIPLHLVAKMVGHSANSVLTLDVYTKFRADYIREMMAYMA